MEKQLAARGHVPHRDEHRRVRLMVVMALAVAPYLNSVRNEFVYDDRALVVENTAIRSLAPSAVAAPALGHYAVEWYRPLTQYSLALNYRFNGRSPAGYHLTNIALHAANAGLLYRIGSLVLNSPQAATLAAGLFAVHPIHVEAVTPVSGRADLLAALLVLVAWLLALETQVTASGGMLTVFLTGLAAFSATLAKENAFAAWPIVALSEVIIPVHGERRSGGPSRGRLPLYVGLSVAFCAAVVFRAAALGGMTAAPLDKIRAIENPLAAASLFVRVATAGWVLVNYCVLLVYPLHLSADYSFNEIPVVASWSDPRLVISVTLVSITAALVFLARRRRPALLGLAVFCIAWLPISNAIFPIGTVMAERLMYLPSVGFCLLAGAALAGPAAGKTDLRFLETDLAIGALLIIVIPLTVARNRVWHSQLTLFANTVMQSPASAKAHFNYATALLEAGRPSDAEREFHRSLKIAPDYPEAHNGRGVALMRLQRLDEAGTQFRLALDSTPTLAAAWMNLGVVFFRQHRDLEAEAALNRAIRLDDALPLAHAHLGALNERRGDRAAAIADYARAYRLDPLFEGLGPHLMDLLREDGRPGDAARLASDLARRRAMAGR